MQHIKILVALAIAAIAPTLLAAPGTSLSVNTNGVLIAPTNTPIQFAEKGVRLDTGVYVLSVAGTHPTNNWKAPYTNAPNGSICVTTNGQFWIRSNATWYSH